MRIYQELKRARVVAGAIAKVTTLEHCIQPYINDNYILVYCGATKVLESYKDYTDVDDEDIKKVKSIIFWI